MDDDDLFGVQQESQEEKWNEIFLFFICNPRRMSLVV
jgi:hypothetical protein